MDPEHPVVKLCAEGARAEMEGDAERAAALFNRAWEVAGDDYHACMAAHMVARYQVTAEDTLRWNEVALERADAVGDERVEGFYPSLLLNLGYSHEMLGDLDQARTCYEEAARRADRLPRDPYGDMVCGGIAAGLGRTRARD